MISDVDYHIGAKLLARFLLKIFVFGKCVFIAAKKKKILSNCNIRNNFNKMDSHVYLLFKWGAQTTSVKSDSAEFFKLMHPFLVTYVILNKYFI